MILPPAPAPFRREIKEARRHERARGLRSRQAGSKAPLWIRLGGCRLNRPSFQRREPPGRFAADFRCPEHLLIAGIDGGYHQQPDQSQVDADRSALLEPSGYRTLLLKNEDILPNLTVALETTAIYPINSRNAAE